ncbi:transcription factor PAP1-domain-containing protein [Podospora fimiseda]|uniref:Transcription factor PAP1-domain-containing protein n=1 Tax=Podospora fimiseda TaxID=252190 RepID=A0AAN7H6A0_9PEZI|nr:transcription factor PAP1-domain-containing protein [Podospora fimiseda]
MTSARNPLHDFMLTPQQQNLLFAALNSNRKGPTTASNMSPLQFNGSPLQGSDTFGGSFQGSPEFDVDYDITGADTSFDFPFGDPSQPKMIGDLPGTASDASKSDSAENTESPDKRSHPDDDEEENPGAKRRESEDKVAKKPGRKPLTTEPTSKRKAQNRAAQRAFRERKEKHLKELETKVEELEKASEASNREKELLRSKIDKMTVELNEYKKRVSALANGSRPSYPGSVPPFGSSFVQNLNDVNFQFEFPKFGQLPGPGKFNTKKASTPSTQRSNSGQLSPTEKTKDSASPTNSSSYSQVGLDSQTRNDIANMTSGLFSPPLSTTGYGMNGGSISLDSQFNGNGGATSTSSPSASSNSNMGGASSSCGTSPEPFTQSPVGFKPVDTLSTIGEEYSGFNNSSQDFGFGNIDPNMDMSWLPQTDFQFEPQLFGDYREPQENVLSQGLDDSFFNDALNVDFVTPYNLPITAEASDPKPGILDQIDAAKCEDLLTPSGNLLTCNKIWEKLQNCPKVQNGDFDLDGLCSDLQKKAKCSGGGAVVDEADFKNVMKKYLCKDEKESTEAATTQQTNI